MIYYKLYLIFHLSKSPMVTQCASTLYSDYLSIQLSRLPVGFPSPARYFPSLMGPFVSTS